LLLYSCCRRGHRRGLNKKSIFCTRFVVSFLTHVFYDFNTIAIFT